MPTLLLKVTPLQNPERYQALAAALTALTAELLHKRPEVTAGVIDDLPRARWCVGGHTVAGTAALLEIGITAGTNTEDEKARFIAPAGPRAANCPSSRRLLHTQYPPSSKASTRRPAHTRSNSPRCRSVTAACAKISWRVAKRLALCAATSTRERKKVI